MDDKPATESLSQADREAADRLLSRIREDHLAATRKGKTTIILLGVLIAFVLGYMTWIYRSVAKLDAEFAVGWASDQFQNELPAMKDRLGDFLKEQAPIVMKEGQARLRQAPRVLRNWVEEWVVSQSAVAFAHFESELDQQLKESLEKQITVIHRVHADGTNIQKIEALMKVFRTTYRERLQTAVDYMYADYALEAQRLREYFSRLQKERQLTETEKLHKELIESWVVLVSKHKILKPEAPPEDLSEDP